MSEKRPTEEPEPTLAPSGALHTDRLIGVYTQNRVGNQLIFFSGIHGNEPSGVRALQQVFSHLHKHRPSFRGSVVGLAGNPPALAQGRRYLKQDLNRLFDLERLRALDQQEAQQSRVGNAGVRPEAAPNTLPPVGGELREALELYRITERLVHHGTPTQRIFVDLHATSAAGGGFSVIRDTEANREIAARMHLPLIFGLETQLQATLMNMMYRLGLTGIVFEGGQIGSTEALEVHTAGIWTLMAGLGCLHPKDVPDYRRHINRMIDAAVGLPKAVQTRYRHALTPGDGFAMKPGYGNFHPVLKGELLAHDRNGPVFAPRDGLLLMPLYQEQGEDGFFLVDPVDY
jgi:succinylglutamate desuccinylase